jgi:hypothetical protein
MGEMRNSYRILVEKPEGKYEAEDMGVGGRIILEWVLEEWGGKMWSGLIWLKIGTGGRLL